MEQDEAWSTGHRYFEMHAYWQWRAEQPWAHDAPQRDLSQQMMVGAAPLANHS